MSVTRIASRYARSLIELAFEQDKLEVVKEDFDAFSEIIKNRDFYLLLKSPIVPAQKKRKIFSLIFDGKFDKLTLAFLNILLVKNREAYLPDIAREFMAQYKTIKHISTVHVHTAEAVSESTIKQIKEHLLGIADDNIEIVRHIDPEMIGGLILEFDGKRYDASVLSKLNSLKDEFSSNLYISQVVSK